MKKIRIIISGILILAIVCFICIFVFTRNQFSSEETAYYLVHSDMLKKFGGIIGIDIEGNVTSQKALKIQDVHEYDFVDGIFIAGGQRANNNLKVDQQGNVEEFILLDNPNYSGVMAITQKDENIIAVMNGNRTDDTYLNLLVIQDQQGNVLEKEIISIFASDMFCTDDIVYIIGSYYNAPKGQWSSKVIRYNLSDATMKENITTKDKDFIEGVLYDGQLYCTLSDANGYTSEIEILDAGSLEKLSVVQFDKDITSLFTYNNGLYGVFDNVLCKIESDYTLMELCSLPQDTYVSSSVVHDNHVYFLSRNEIVDRSNGYAELGFIIDYDLVNDKMQSTPVKLPKKHSDSVVFFPIVEQE